MDKVANTIEELFELFPDRRYYYAHKDGRVGFLENHQIHWFIYDGNVGGFVDKEFTEHPQMAKLTRVK
jgi:hypothetical protein